MKQFLLSLFSILFFSAVTFSQSVSVSKQVYSPGETISINYSGFAGNYKDWISIAAKGSGDDKYLVWQYLNASRSGTITFNGMAYGEYEVRGYFDGSATIKARQSFRVGNANTNVIAKPDKDVYQPFERVTINFSGMPGNVKDWISIAPVSSKDDLYSSWSYTDGKQSGTLQLAGAAEGSYEVRTYFNGEGTVRTRTPFTIGKKASKICKTELSVFYAGMNSLGLAWGRLGIDALSPTMISEVKAVLNNAVAGLKVVPCLSFDVNRIHTFSASFPNMPKQQAVNEIDRIIKDILAATQRAPLTCDKSMLLEPLMQAGVHLGAAQASANFFICRSILPEWQTNIGNHLQLARSSISRFHSCVPSFDLGSFNLVSLSDPNATIPFTRIIAIHTSLLWNVSLTECCCTCK